ncbi:DUF2478 domain-containing protein [Breoghania sp.]|uniref:DUF2478 domain-containing protein n=1 Tax=Breoghania sp. TaxID=2065378 RepID=UPI002AA85187|nr:DUF2478 domain-containing protein [Breoghania sp.]
MPDLSDPDQPPETADLSCLLAAIVFAPGEDVDTILSEVAAENSGLRLAGVVQTGGDRDGCDVREMALKSLRDGWVIRILEDRGSQSQGCRLNPHAITEVAGRLERELEAGADLLLVNRFGRAESEGYGLRPVFERAVLDGVPVLTAVRSDYLGAWEEFHGGLGIALPREKQAVRDWATKACTGKTPA